MPVSTQSGLSENAAGAISYITFVPAIVFLVMPPYNASPYVRFHSWQSILLFVSAILLNIVLSMLTVLILLMGPFAVVAVFRFVSVLWLLLWLFCVLQALNGKRCKLPLIGNIADLLSAR
jgi:uncharacterized membrane protein